MLCQALLVPGLVSIDDVSHWMRRLQKFTRADAVCWLEGARNHFEYSARRAQPQLDTMLGQSVEEIPMDATKLLDLRLQILLSVSPSGDLAAVVEVMPMRLTVAPTPRPRLVQDTVMAMLRLSSKERAPLLGAALDVALCCLPQHLQPLMVLLRHVPECSCQWQPCHTTAVLRQAECLTQ